MDFNVRDIQFLYELGSLRNMPRSWRQTVGMDVANDLEHTLRVVWLALILARREGGVDDATLMKMALVHDIAETRTGDQNYQQTLYVTADETRAAHDIFADTGIADMEVVLHEYEKRVSLEAQIVKDADNLDIDLELRELEERGSKLPAKWRKHRELVRKDKLYTQAARDLWDALDEVDVADWHITANKWFKVPHAGR